ncbi:MAG TPA: tetratricopeptide repeat protein, partial [Bacteroidia bacterium]|nr:tetratricopeptide repeat protein [Bacteroidia bacterium]
MHKVLKTPQTDTAKVFTLNRLCEVLWRTANYDSAMANAIQQRALAEKLVSSTDAAIAKAGKNGLAGAYRVMGIIYRHHGNFPKALELELKALDLCKETGNADGIASNTGNIGIVYWNMNNYDKALEYYLKAEALNEASGNKNHLAANIGNIGILYRLKGNFTKALEYEYRALDMQSQIGDQSGMATNIGNIGLIYMHQGKFDTALKYDFKALAMIRKINEQGGIAINQSNIGSIYIFQKKFALAKIYLDSAMQRARKINEKEQIKNIYADFCDLDSATGNYKALAADFKTYITYRDSLVNEANTEKAMQTELSSEFEQKQVAIKAEQDKKDAVAEQERKKQAIILYSFMAGFGLLLVLAFFIYRGYRQKQKANTIITEQKKEVEQQKAIVEEKNKDITASIRYASRIQRALLTTDEYIGEHLKDYFILFKPRDIVSGDFYWAYAAPPPPEGGINDDFGYETADPILYGKLKDFVKEHRSAPTEAENIFWQLVRGKNLNGYKFRRQHIIGHYIADFVCLPKKLVIEIDGLIH